MSNHGIFRAKYKNVPLQSKPAKSMTDAVPTKKGFIMAQTYQTSDKQKSIMKVSAPHLTCYNNSDSNENSGSSSKDNGIEASAVDENGNTDSNLLKPSSATLSLKSLTTVHSHTSFETNSRVDLSCTSICKAEIVPEVVSVREKSRSISLNGLEMENVNVFQLDTDPVKNSLGSSENSESIVRELESKLKCSTSNKRYCKLKKSKSVKFNLDPANATAAPTATTGIPILAPNPGQQQMQQPENLETVGGAVNEFPHEFPMNDVEQATTLTGFFSSFLPLSWPDHVNLNPIPAITRSTTGFLIAAYDIGARIVSTGIQIANSILSDGIEVAEPREDIIQYNGFTIRTYGRELLLQSLYVNCERRHEIRPRGAHRRRPSSPANSATTATATSTCPSCNSIFNHGGENDGNTPGNLRMRIVIEVTALPENANTNRAEHSYLTNGETRVVSEGGRWSLIYGSMMEGLVEIKVPDTVEAESLTYRGPVNGIIVIDIP